LVYQLLLLHILLSFCELQVYYEFNPVFMLAEPLMLIAAALLFFVACIAYLHMDLSIGKSQAS
jgi:oligosaccharyltransferase complex subunit alpha (ribophorin I)